MWPLVMTCTLHPPHSCLFTTAFFGCVGHQPKWEINQACINSVEKRRLQQGSTNQLKSTDTITHKKSENRILHCQGHAECY